MSKHQFHWVLKAFSPPGSDASTYVRNYPSSPCLTIAGSPCRQRGKTLPNDRDGSQRLRNHFLIFASRLLRWERSNIICGVLRSFQKPKFIIIFSKDQVYIKKRAYLQIRWGTTGPEKVSWFLECKFKQATFKEESMCVLSSLCNWWDFN